MPAEYQAQSHYNGTTSTALWRKIARPWTRQIESSLQLLSEGKIASPGSDLYEAIAAPIHSIETFATRPYNPEDQTDIVSATASDFEALHKQVTAAKTKNSQNQTASRILDRLVDSTTELRDQAERWCSMSGAVIDQNLRELSELIRITAEGAPEKLKWWQRDPTEEGKDGSIPYSRTALGHFTGKVQHLSRHDDYTNAPDSLHVNRELKGTAVINDLVVDASKMASAIKNELDAVPADGSNDRALLQLHSATIQALPYWLDKSLWLRSLNTEGSLPRQMTG